MMGKYIVVEGNIGAGKTSLVKKLSNELNGEIILEDFAENTFLPQFYQDPAAFGFPLELSFLAARYRQLTQFKGVMNRGLFIADYHFEKSLLFARMNLDGAELQLYESFFKIMAELLPVPDLVVFLNAEVDSVKQNIVSRGREFEKEITNQYLQKLRINYLNEIEKFSKRDFLRIDTKGIDFINNDEDYKFIVSMVTEKLSAKNC